MPLPETIPLRYTEDDAGNMSVRPVVKQTFRLPELIDMVVSIAGKNAARVQQILRSGTVVYHGYRYWWDSLSAELSELERLLVPFPDDDPSRPFVSHEVTAVLFEMGGGTQRAIAELTRQEASARKLFAKNSPWDVLLAFASSHPARYERFDHGHKADLFRLIIPFDQAQSILAALLAAAPRKLRYRWSTLRPPAALTFVCPRK
jgi:hypothetical protein